MNLPPCDKCHKEQTEPGAVLYGSPLKIVKLDFKQFPVRVDKFNLCVICYEAIRESIGKGTEA